MVAVESGVEGETGTAAVKAQAQGSEDGRKGKGKKGNGKGKGGGQKKFFAHHSDVTQGVVHPLAFGYPALGKGCRVQFESRPDDKWGQRATAIRVVAAPDSDSKNPKD